MIKFDVSTPNEISVLLRSLIGQKLISIRRIVRYPLDQMGKDLNLSEPSEYFRLSPGDVFLFFDSGQCIRISSDSRRKTILLSSSGTNIEEEAAIPDYLDRTGFILSADDQKYSDDRIKKILGKTVENIGMIFVNETDSRSINQRGIVFYIKNQPRIIIGLQLREEKVSHLGFLEFDDLNVSLRPSLIQTGINGESLPC